MTLLTRDANTGLMRSVIRFRDGSPPLPDGCRWCGIPEETHGDSWSAAVAVHTWTQPTAAQVDARRAARLRHGLPVPSPTAPVSLDNAIAGFRAANEHVRSGCTSCTPAVRLPDMCEEGRALALAAVHTLT